MEAYVKFFLLRVFLIWRNLKLYEVKFNLLCKSEKKILMLGIWVLKKKYMHKEHDYGGGQSSRRCRLLGAER